MPPAGDPPGPRSSSWRRLAWNALELVVLSSFAVAQPLFDLFGNNGTFFVAHDASGRSIVEFAVLVLVVPPTVLFLLETLVWLAHRPILRVVHTAILGVLASLTVAPALNRALGDDSLLGLVLFLVIAVGAGAAFWFVGWVHTLVRFAVFAPLLFFLNLILISPVSALIQRDDPVAYATAARTEIPIVWLVFDEWPLSSIVGPDGQINRDRFPNLGRLQDISTWYPNSVSLSVSTSLTMSSALSGRYGEWGDIPVASEYPTSVFTLLGGSYHVVADETVTRLCPTSVCGEVTAREAPSGLWADTIVVLTRTLLPAEVADGLVPPMNDRWAGFGDVEDLAPTVTEGVVAADGAHRERVRADVQSDQRERVSRFLSQIDGSRGPTLYYLHLVVPHLPLRYVPGGISYADSGPLGWALESNDLWTTDEDMMDLVHQRLILQMQYTDEQVGRVLDRLEEVGMLDESLLIVMSDHGQSLIPGTRRKARNEVTLDDALPVPLFVKLPTQVSARTDLRIAQQTDVLPTVLELTGVAWPAGYESVGRSLLAPPDDEVVVLTRDGVEELTEPPSAVDSPTVDRLHRLLIDDSNGYTLAPHGALVGSELDELQIIGEPRMTVAIRDKESLRAVDLASGAVPIHVVGTVQRHEERVHVAVAINGVIAGVGRSYPAMGSWRISAITDPRFFRDGSNEIALFEIDEGGQELRPIAVLP